jgi:4-hydroxy-tetrahydrodipicolinate synthase
MIEPGVYPAAVTPLGERERIDPGALARLLAWFRSAGCRGAVLAGTNGEGPSLSATEKRDLIRTAGPIADGLDLILGIATTSLEEAVWLSRQAADAGAVAVLAMAPFYFRDAPETGVETWFRGLLDRSPLPVLLYNFPSRTGFPLRPEMLARLAGHENLAGAKDSSGERANLHAYRQALGPERRLFVGDETLLMDALRAGWAGTISGASNVLPAWIAQICREFRNDPEAAEAKFALVLPAIRELRGVPQPALNKALLRRMGVLSDARLKPPLVDADESLVEAKLRALGPFAQTRVGPT